MVNTAILQRFSKNKEKKKKSQKTSDFQISEKNKEKKKKS